MSINIMRAKRVKALLLASALGLGLTACGDSGTELNAERHLERANAYEDQGQYRAAIIEFKNAVKKSAGESGAIVAYASMLNELGQHQSALALLDQFQGKPDAVFTAVRIESLMGAGKYRSAKEVLNSLDSLPAHERTLFEARLALSDGDLSKAETLFRSLHDHPEVGARARLGTASLLARGQQYAEAAGMVSSINEQSDSYARARLLLAGINIANNELDRAESVLSDLLAKLPNTDLMKPERATALERLASSNR